MLGTRHVFFVIQALFAILVEPAAAWDWEEYLGSNDNIVAFQTHTLGMAEIRDMRVRDIKRRLTRIHGYSADEVGRMLDKEELIQALSFEEHKEREKELQRVKRYVIVKGLMVTLIAIVAVMFWPLWVQMYEVASVNLVVYTDKKKYEATRCLELQSWEGMIGVVLMGIVDGLQVWLSMSILLSWFISSAYFFPTPNLSFRPATFMGENVSQGPLAKYGLNLGPMVLTAAFRFLQGQLETFTGRALSRALQKQKKAARDRESPQEMADRKAARKAARKAVREDAERRNLEAEMDEKRRRKEAAAKATLALFSPTSLEEQTQRKQEDELHKVFVPILTLNSDVSEEQAEQQAESTHTTENVE
jgi:hypothetical protein